MTFGYDDYNVAIICPLEVEMSAMRYMLDEEHVRLPGKDNDHNRYILGKLGKHNVAIGYLPQGSQGIGAAAIVATDMRRTFTSIQLRLLVGIGGGTPSPKNDIYLGDVVVGMPDDIHGGVVQYDLGKQTVDGFKRQGFLCPPPVAWRTAVVEMQSDYTAKSNKISEFILQMLETYPKLRKYSRPAPELDVLFPPDIEHRQGESTCDDCGKDKAISRRGVTDPQIFYGTIASGDSVIKNAYERDALSTASGGALCFEMEAAGLSNELPCVVIRGICDYADSHKNDVWHPYAAAAAAACAKELLTCIDLAPVPTVPTLKSYYLVPRQQATNFFGREEELVQISSFFNKETETSRILVLHAMGGQGKTQIALKYCHRARKKYRGIFWINSSLASSAAQSLVTIAHSLDASAVAGLSNEAKADFVRHTLERWDGLWLMVLDNCDNPTYFEDVEHFIPQGGKGNVLFTSRHQGLRELGHLIEIPPMPNDPGVALLLHRYRNINTSQYQLQATPIVKRLGGLALALDQASAYLEYKGIPIGNLSDFLEQYEDNRKKVLQHTAEHFWRYTKINDA
ncbi:hypothetical protein LTR84_012274 [Exophiala bonariae]|uniref:NB-ARC domain-containing protein n=1 Tax=Exophiala bonariae TaxID=1690606 RepID=A0AAV9NFR8_9EURO|nr:hypothetical protein LTR84_012274 [Exophiala bonariae]